MNELESNKVNAVSKLWSGTRLVRSEACRALFWLVFVLGPTLSASAATFTNPTSIFAGSAAAGPNPYPSTITVSQLSGEITSVTATLVNITHPNPQDLDVLLVGPTGQTVLLLSDAGGTTDVTNVTVTFSAATRFTIPQAGPLVAGTYLPSNYAPADNFPNGPAAPYGGKLSLFNGTSPNGVWRLYVMDDSILTGAGGIAGGWRLTINTTNRPPVITTPLTSQTVPSGANVEFHVTVDGTPPFGYQWLFNGDVVVPFGQGSDTLRLFNVQEAQEGTYTVQVTNGARINLPGILAVPVVASNQASLVVNTPLQVTEPLPSGIDAQPGQNVTLTVKATGEPPLRYQWFCNGAVITNATSSSLRLVEITPFKAGRYSVVVWNGVESVRSGPTLVRVLYETAPRPRDFFQERPQLTDASGVVQGSNVDASSEFGEPLWTDAGAVGKTMWLQLTPPDSGILTVRTRGSAFDTLLSIYTGLDLRELKPVSQDDDSGGCYTSELRFNVQRGRPYQIQIDGGGDGPKAGWFTLSWNLQVTTLRVPEIVRAPLPQVVKPGEDAEFRVVTSATDESYQWFYYGPPYDKPEPIRGAVDPVLIIPKANSRDVGFYAVGIRNGFDQFVLSPLVPLQLGSFPYLIGDKFSTRSASFVFGGTYLPFGLGNFFNNTLPSAASRSEGDPEPCGDPFVGTLWLGLAVTNNGVIQVETTGSAIPTRMAVYKLTGDLFADLNAPAVICDLSSASNGVPCVAKFNAKDGTNYTVVVEGYEASGNISITAKMGVAPPLTNALKYCLVADGGTLVLQSPAGAWCPLPACQWRLDGVDIPDATNSTLSVPGFSALDAGTYSIFVSNFVGFTSRNIAIVELAPPFELQSSWVTNTAIRFWIAASNATPFVLETTTTLSGPWTPIATNPDPCLILNYTNQNPFVDPRRFYRAVPWTP